MENNPQCNSINLFYHRGLFRSQGTCSAEGLCKGVWSCCDSCDSCSIGCTRHDGVLHTGVAGSRAELYDQEILQIQGSNCPSMLRGSVIEAYLLYLTVIEGVFPSLTVLNRTRRHPDTHARVSDIAPVAAHSCARTAALTRLSELAGIVDALCPAGHNACASRVDSDTKSCNGANAGVAAVAHAYLHAAYSHMLKYMRRSSYYNASDDSNGEEGATERVEARSAFSNALSHVTSVSGCKIAMRRHGVAAAEGLLCLEARMKKRVRKRPDLQKCATEEKETWECSNGEELLDAFVAERLGLLLHSGFRPAGINRDRSKALKMLTFAHTAGLPLASMALFAIYSKEGQRSKATRFLLSATTARDVCCNPLTTLEKREPSQLPHFVRIHPLAQVHKALATLMHESRRGSNREPEEDEHDIMFPFAYRADHTPLRSSIPASLKASCLHYIDASMTAGDHCCKFSGRSGTGSDALPSDGFVVTGRGHCCSVTGALANYRLGLLYLDSLGQSDRSTAGERIALLTAAVHHLEVAGGIVGRSRVGSLVPQSAGAVIVPDALAALGLMHLTGSALVSNSVAFPSEEHPFIIAAELLKAAASVTSSCAVCASPGHKANAHSRGASDDIYAASSLSALVFVGSALLCGWLYSPDPAMGVELLSAALRRLGLQTLQVGDEDQIVNSTCEQAVKCREDELNSRKIGGNFCGNSDHSIWRNCFTTVSPAPKFVLTVAAAVHSRASSSGDGRGVPKAASFPGICVENVEPTVGQVKLLHFAAMLLLRAYKNGIYCQFEQEIAAKGSPQLSTDKVLTNTSSSDWSKKWHTVVPREPVKVAVLRQQRASMRCWLKAHRQQPPPRIPVQASTSSSAKGASYSPSTSHNRIDDEVRSQQRRGAEHLQSGQFDQASGEPTLFSIEVAEHENNRRLNSIRPAESTITNDGKQRNSARGSDYAAVNGPSCTETMDEAMANACLVVLLQQACTASIIREGSRTYGADATDVKKDEVHRGAGFVPSEDNFDISKEGFPSTGRRAYYFYRRRRKILNSQCLSYLCCCCLCGGFTCWKESFTSMCAGAADTFPCCCFLFKAASACGSCVVGPLVLFGDSLGLLKWSDGSVHHAASPTSCCCLHPRCFAGDTSHRNHFDSIASGGSSIAERDSAAGGWCSRAFCCWSWGLGGDLDTKLTIRRTESAEHWERGDGNRYSSVVGCVMDPVATYNPPR